MQGPESVHLVMLPSPTSASKDGRFLWAGFMNGFSHFLLYYTDQNSAIRPNLIAKVCKLRQPSQEGEANKRILQSRDSSSFCCLGTLLIHSLGLNSALPYLPLGHTWDGCYLVHCHMQRVTATSARKGRDWSIARGRFLRVRPASSIRHFCHASG